MEIFAVVVEYVVCDRDASDYWAEEDIKSYHSTKEGADKALKHYQDTTSSNNKSFIKTIDVLE